MTKTSASEVNRYPWPEPMFSFQTWMFDTEKNGLISRGLYCKMCNGAYAYKNAFNFHSKTAECVPPQHLDLLFLITVIHAGL